MRVARRPPRGPVASATVLNVARAPLLRRRACAADPSAEPHERSQARSDLSGDCSKARGSHVGADSAHLGMARDGQRFGTAPLDDRVLAGREPDAPRRRPEPRRDEAPVLPGGLRLLEHLRQGLARPAAEDEARLLAGDHDLLERTVEAVGSDPGGEIARRICKRGQERDARLSGAAAEALVDLSRVRLLGARVEVVHTGGDRRVDGREPQGQERPGGRDDGEGSVECLRQRVPVGGIGNGELVARLRALLELLSAAAQEPHRQSELTELLADERAGVTGGAENGDGLLAGGQEAEDTVPE